MRACHSLIYFIGNHLLGKKMGKWYKKHRCDKKHSGVNFDYYSIPKNSFAEFTRESQIATASSRSLPTAVI